MKRLNLALLVILAFALVLAQASTPTASAQSVPMVAYTVQPGDTLAKIAARYCTTWEEIYQINAAVIGPDPNVLKPGTVLYVPNRCAAPPSNCAVYDHGPSPVRQRDGLGQRLHRRGRRHLVFRRRALWPAWETIPRRTAAAGCIPAASYHPGTVQQHTATRAAVLPQHHESAGRREPARHLHGQRQGRGLDPGQRDRDRQGQRRSDPGAEGDDAQGANVGTGGEGTWSTSLTVNASTVTSGAISHFARRPGDGGCLDHVFGRWIKRWREQWDQRGVRARSMHDLRPARRADVPVPRRPDGRPVRDGQSGRGEAAHGLQQHGLVHDPAGSLDGQSARVGAGHQPVVGWERL